jgi:hypothetical protein
MADTVTVPGSGTRTRAMSSRSDHALGAPGGQLHLPANKPAACRHMCHNFCTAVVVFHTPVSSAMNKFVRLGQVSVASTTIQPVNASKDTGTSKVKLFSPFKVRCSPDLGPRGLVLGTKSC